MRTFLEIVKTGVGMGAKDVILIAGQPVMFKIGDSYMKLDDGINQALTPGDTEKLVKQAFDLANRNINNFLTYGDDQFAISVSGLSRMRISAFKQRNSSALAVRIIPFGIPNPKRIGIPDEVMSIADLRDGLVLFCGPSGSGKSTTMACVVNAINNSRCCHIVTVESPIEYLFRNNIGFVSQREVVLDTKSMAEGVRLARWLDPDVFMASEMDCEETADELVRLADGNRLVLAALNVKDPASAIETVLSMMGADKRRLESARLARVLRAVVCQRLVPDENGNLVSEFEIAEIDSNYRKFIAAQNIDAIREYLAPSSAALLHRSSQREEYAEEGEKK